MSDLERVVRRAVVVLAAAVWVACLAVAILARYALSRPWRDVAEEQRVIDGPAAIREREPQLDQEEPTVDYEPQHGWRTIAERRAAQWARESGEWRQVVPRVAAATYEGWWVGHGTWDRRAQAFRRALVAEAVA